MKSLSSSKELYKGLFRATTQSNLRGRFFCGAIFIKVVKGY